MDERREEELLMHVAAGTDLLTALAALPRDNDVQDEPLSSSSKRSIGGMIWVVLILAAMIALWWLIS